MPAAVPARPFIDQPVGPAPHAILAPAGQAVPAAQARRQSPVAKQVRSVRQAFRMEGRNAKPSADNLKTVFDGLQSAQGGGVVDTRPSTDDDEIDGGPVEQPLPWVEPAGRPATLPEWDLEREIGIR